MKRDFFRFLKAKCNQSFRERFYKENIELLIPLIPQSFFAAYAFYDVVSITECHFTEVKELIVR